MTRFCLFVHHYECGYFAHKELNLRLKQFYSSDLLVFLGVLLTLDDDIAVFRVGLIKVPYGPDFHWQCRTGRRINQELYLGSAICQFFLWDNFKLERLCALVFSLSNFRYDLLLVDP